MELIQKTIYEGKVYYFIPGELSPISPYPYLLMTREVNPEIDFDPEYEFNFVGFLNALKNIFNLLK